MWLLSSLTGDLNKIIILVIVHIKIRVGGVLLDLSHELDYATWIFGSLKPQYSQIKKISSLKIQTEDFVKIIGKINKTYTQIELNYFDKVPRRKIRVEGNNFFLKLI